MNQNLTQLKLIFLPSEGNKIIIIITSSKSAITTLQPLAKNAFTAAKPSPDAPPVTKQTIDLSSLIIQLFLKKNSM